MSFVILTCPPIFWSSFIVSIFNWPCEGTALPVQKFYNSPVGGSYYLLKSKRRLKSSVFSNVNPALDNLLPTISCNYGVELAWPHSAELNSRFCLRAKEPAVFVSYLACAKSFSPPPRKGQQFVFCFYYLSIEMKNKIPAGISESENDGIIRNQAAFSTTQLRNSSRKARHFVSPSCSIAYV